eukprot:2146415-Lingulodinium_polyedra.AAC.1
MDVEGRGPDAPYGGSPSWRANESTVGPVAPARSIASATRLSAVPWRPRVVRSAASTQTVAWPTSR